MFIDHEYRTGPTVTHRHEPVPKNEFLKSLDEESEGWTAGDYGSQPSVSGAGFQSANISDRSRSGDIVPAEESRERSLVQSLDDSVEFWTDYLKAHLHPRSVYELPNTFYGVTPFDNYSCGLGFFKEQEQLEEVENRLRFFVEECDHLQVFFSWSFLPEGMSVSSVIICPLMVTNGLFVRVPVLVSCM